MSKAFTREQDEPDELEASPSASQATKNYITRPGYDVLRNEFVGANSKLTTCAN